MALEIASADVRQPPSLLFDMLVRPTADCVNKLHTAVDAHPAAGHIHRQTH
jgi:hypothetical protein